MYPNIHNISKVLLTMPVSTASAERSFSCLRHLITYPRNSMTETGLTGLALISIHKDFEIDTEKVLRQFDAPGTRGVNLSLQVSGLSQPDSLDYIKDHQRTATGTFHHRTKPTDIQRSDSRLQIH
ncbi:hypothetical protein ANANG_G00004980 [Anguilla anguilla]|uniref:HAT C-terminal dimerisation domain-containing protein n=1 Tax=Anguilla anguilla TaxID=7936 RepID=A0A9D3SAQ0_ANGAN|nr:hypothetical protein ANANG_G00004980 [Anguilla anguilla]